MENILFISERTVKENSILETNVEPKLVRITIKEVQDLDLLPIIGKEKYSEIVEELTKKKENRLYDIKEDIKTLLDLYIRDFLIYGVLLNIPTSLTYKATKKGFKNITDANATDIIGGDIENVKRFYRAKYDAYRKRLIDYVQTTCNSNLTTAPNVTGWYLPKGVNVAKAQKAGYYKTGYNR